MNKMDIYWNECMNKWIYIEINGCINGYILRWMDK